MVAAMTLAERFAEHGKRRQKPWLAKLEPVRPGPVARHPPPRSALGLTQRPGERQSCLLCVTTSRAGPGPAPGII
jgi:hypothetical protein